VTSHSAVMTWITFCLRTLVTQEHFKQFSNLKLLSSQVKLHYVYF